MVFNTLSFDKRAGFAALTDAQKKQLHLKRLLNAVAMMFIAHADKHWYGETARRNAEQLYTQK